MSKILSRIETVITVPWLDMDILINSKCFRHEIYLPETYWSLEAISILFYRLFGDDKNDFVIKNGTWGEFCLSTFDLNTGNQNYDISNVAGSCRKYLNLLEGSEILFEDESFCVCNDWDTFLSTILPCIIEHEAPYSPIFYSAKYGYAFYFHHTFSIGLLFQKKGKRIDEILKNASDNNYQIRENNINI